MAAKSVDTLCALSSYEKDVAKSRYLYYMAVVRASLEACYARKVLRLLNGGGWVDGPDPS